MTAGPHLTTDELVSLIERTCDGDDEHRCFRHLLQCDGCLGQFQVVARSRAFVRHGPLAQNVPPAQPRAPVAAVAGTRPSVTAPQPEPHSIIIVRPRRIARRLAALAAGLVIVSAALWLWLGGAPESKLEAGVTNPILTAMTDASSRSFVVIPGAELELVTTNGAYRSGRFVDDEAVSASLLVLSKRYQNGDRSREVLCWMLAGFLSTRQIHAASDVARNASRLHPDDERIATLSGLVAYFEGDLEAAADRLEFAAEGGECSGVAAVNLGVVLMEKGERARARAILDEVHRAQPDTPLGERAAWLLKSYR